MTIHNKKFYFIVDTGASVTVLDASIAASLYLPPVGKPGTATTIGCTVPVQPVAISAWSIGGQKLPTSVVPSQKTNLAGKTYGGLPIAGLLGADLYYLYGTMTLNYTAATLNLGGPAVTGKQSFPITTTLTRGGVHLTAVVTIHGHQGGFSIDTGASTTEINGELAQQAGLKHAGPATKTGALSCQTTVQPVTFDGARIGTVALPTVIAGSSTNALTAKTQGAVEGLLGADILSHYGTVTFDFNHHKVALG